MRKVLTFVGVISFLFIFVMACGGGGDDLTAAQAKLVLQDKLGDPYFQYLNVNGIKPDSALGTELQKLIDTGVFVYEWGDVRRVFVPSKPEASSYVKGDVYIYLNGTLSADIAVNKVFINEILTVQAKKTEALVRYTEKYATTPLQDLIKNDESLKSSLDEAIAAGDIKMNGEEREIKLIKVNEAWIVPQ